MILYRSSPLRVQSVESWCDPSVWLQIPPPCRVFLGFEGGGTVENQDPSGASGGLFDLIFFICIAFLYEKCRLMMVIFKKYIVLFAEIHKGKEENIFFV